MHAPAFDPAALPAKAHVVLEAASTVFLEHGFSAATTDMIQRQARVSKATVYAQFPNKEALFRAVIQQRCQDFMQAVTGVSTREGPLRARLTRLGQAYLELLTRPWAIALFRVVVAEARRFPALAEGFHAAGPAVMQRLVARQLEQGAAEGELDVDRIGAAAAATVFIALLRNEALMQGLIHPAHPPSTGQRDQWVTLAVDTFLAAYGLSQARAAR